MGIAVALRNVSKVYQNGDTRFQALSDVNLAVERGIIQGVIGSSGAGKSTLLRCVSLLENPDEGQVLVDGIDLATLEGETLRTARRKIGIIFQQFHLLRSRTVYGNVALPLELAGRDATEVAARVQDLLRWFGLEEKAGSYPAQLSGGQRQRVAVARALATNPSVLLSDEPTSAGAAANPKGASSCTLGRAAGEGGCERFVPDLKSTRSMRNAPLSSRRTM
ncbi:methionine ABC transporter ATP-binding protein [Terriglobus roseus]|uniref:D-methionine transport system ATP-binding protein n=1 Tax=Terriglobus roseus TaxID=392734 RepID=A0A1H4K4Y7_9BACT|nr:ATP-binding cassette domain-containing protein [Terriglobus roseus]SEB53611.1 D-methionine transport system ATP-binding protein [Terriglobus roseus]